MRHEFCVVVKICPLFTSLFANLDTKNCLKYNNHRDGIHIFNSKNEGSLYIIQEESRDFSSCYSDQLSLGIKPGAHHLNRASGTRANLTSANFQTKHLALYVVKFSNSQTFGLKPKDPILKMQPREEELPKEGLPKVAAAVLRFCE